MKGEIVKTIEIIGKKFLFTNQIRKIINKSVRKGKHCNIANSKFEPYSFIGNFSNLQSCKIGAYTSIGRFANIFSCELGKFCSVSWNVTIGAPSHPISHISTHAFPYVKMFNITSKDERIRNKTIIGNDVWIGAGAIIMPSIEIGNGAVIGAGAIITKDVPPYAIVVGNPGKILRYRFGKEIIHSLEELKWWNWNEKKLVNNLKHFKRPLDQDLLDLLTRINSL